MSTDTESSFSPADLVQSTFEAISDAIFVVALPERTIAHCNAAAAEMFGYERDALVGSNTECIHVDETNWEEFHEESIEPLEKQGYFRGEFEMKRSVVQDVTVQKHYERELQNRALEDGLTGLPNRTLFRDRLEYALERSEQSDGSVAVAFLDLDRFQVVNKTLGAESLPSSPDSSPSSRPSHRQSRPSPHSPPSFCDSGDALRGPACAPRQPGPRRCISECESRTAPYDQNLPYVQ